MRLIVLLILCAGGWFVYREWKRNADLEARNARLQSDVANERGKLTAEEKAEREVIDDLKRRRATEQQEVDRLTNELNSRSNLGYDHTFSQHEQEERKKHQDELKSLEAGLAQIRAQESDLAGGGKQNRAASQAAEKARREELNGQIGNLNGHIQDEKKQIAELRKARFDQNAQAQATSLQGNLDADQQQLASLKSDRSSLGTAYGSARAQSDAQNHESMAELKQSEAGVRAQIDAEKDSIRHADQALGSESHNEKDLRDWQSKLQSDLGAHQGRARELDARIAEETAKLRAITGK